MALVFLVKIVAGAACRRMDVQNRNKCELHLLSTVSSRHAFDNSNFEHVFAKGNDARQCSS